MAWSSLSTRFVTVPLVLAGPIVRRVELTSASVWIACARAKSCTLRVFDAAGQVIASSPATPTVPVGERVHLAVLTASPGASDLLPRTVYEYDITFADADPSMSPVGLDGTGVMDAPGFLDGASVSGIHWLTYGSHSRPSFITPAESLAQTRIVHGSCRKPHGGGEDALGILDTILSATAVNSHEADERVQQLYLTGDQIYADDVADALLWIIDDARLVLLGPSFVEPLPNIPALQEEEALYPFKRAYVVRHENGADPHKDHFTSGSSRSHLVRYGDFVAMYLLAWSPSLWPPDLPTRELLFPQGDPRGPGGPGLEGLAWFGDACGAWKEFKKQAEALSKFREALPRVRRTLANVATYMMCDDHEVTDDWFLDAEWTATCLAAGSLSRRIIQNGLVAFTLFQAWGNVPGRYAAVTPGATALDAIAQLAATSGTDPQAWARVDAALMPRLIDRPGGISALVDGLEHDFSIQFQGHRLVCLNTRTRRGFRAAAPGADPNRAMLIAPDALAGQLAPSGSGLTVVISPAPVVGLPLLEDKVQPIIAALEGPPGADEEAWVSDPAAFQFFLDALALFGSVVILSGDVHYAFSNLVHYWNERTSPAGRATYVQLCSSSLHNADSLTNLLQLVQGQAPKLEYLGWDGAGCAIFERRVNANPRTLTTTVIDSYVTTRGAPTVLPYWRTLSTGVDIRTRWVVPRPGRPAAAGTPAFPPPEPMVPSWSYRIAFARDERAPSWRGYSGALTAAAVAGTAAAADLHRRRADYDSTRVVVGETNLGLLRFLGTPGHERVRHELWYAPKSGSASRPYTVHELPLAILHDSDPRPGED
jgi:hypothetical protein